MVLIFRYGGLAAGVLACGCACAQIKKQFTIEDSPACKQIRLTLEAGRGNCVIKPGQYSDILNVYSNLDASSYSQNYVREIVDGTCNVSFSLEAPTSRDFGDAISYTMFRQGETTPGDNIWKMYLTDEKPYALELNYGVGSANIDLSGLAIQRIHVNSGSADIDVGYYSGMENKVEMDTFLVKVNWGSVNVSNLNMAHARNVVADVGFGNVVLDFSQRPSVSNTVKGSVGAGNLIIILPAQSTPVLLKIKDSWLCSARVPRYFTQVDGTTFRSPTYTDNAPRSITFDLDVSMGNIIFRPGQE